MCADQVDNNRTLEHLPIADVTVSHYSHNTVVTMTGRVKPDASCTLHRLYLPQECYMAGVFGRIELMVVDRLMFVIPMSYVPAINAIGFNVHINAYERFAITIELICCSSKAALRSITAKDLLIFKT